MNVVLSLLRRAVLLAAGWWVLADGSFYNWPVGLGVVAVATLATWWLSPPAGRPRLSPRRVWAGIGLTGWFLWRSAVGGIDVARRAATRVPDVDPQYVEHRFRLPPGNARMAVAYLNNLMPGSLSVHIGDVVQIHSIATELPTLEQVTELEERVAAAAGIDLG